MNDSSSAPAASPKPAKAKRTPGLLNQEHMRKLDKTDSIVTATQEENRADALAAREITADLVTEVVENIAAARAKAGEIVQHRADTRVATEAEAIAAEKLIGGLQEVQKAAKQKYAKTNRPALIAYFVGKPLNGSRANLSQTSQSIVDKAGADTLPGYTLAKSKALIALRKTWVAANKQQTDSATAAKTALADFKVLLKSIETKRAEIQLAADAEWPHTDEANAAIRREFRLPANRPHQA